MGTFSYQCLHQHKHSINQCQSNGHYQQSMSTPTQVLNRSMPNQWALSAINVYMDATMLSINAKPMGTISYQCLHGCNHVIDQCQTNGHNQLSMSTGTQALNRSLPNQWARSAINVNMDTSRQFSMPNHWEQSSTLSLEQGHEYSLAAIKAESLYQLSIFLAVSLKLGCNSVITSMLCYIYNVASNHNMDLSEL